MANDPADLLARYRRLTPRQQTFVRSLADAAGRTEIAAALGISLSLVDKETAAVMRAFDLQEEGLTRAQRCVELRRRYLQLRKLERSEVPPPAPTAPPEPERAAEPSPQAASDDREGAAPADRPPPLVVLPPAIPTPPASSAPWRWWPLAAALLLLALTAGAWWVTHAAGQTALAGTPATSTTATPAVAASVPARTPAGSPTATPPPATPTPVPPATATIDPAATPVDLAGKVDSTIPGTPLQLGSVVTSIIDEHTKPQDLYAVQLQAGSQFHLALTASSAEVTVRLGPAGALPSFAGGDPVLCSDLTPNTSCAQSIPIAQTGTYLLLVQAGDSGVRYTLQASTLPLVVPPGVTDLAGTVASNVPGTPLALGTSVLSVVDPTTKRLDIYALHLLAGQALRVQISATPAAEVVLLLPPDTVPFTGTPNWTTVPLICNGQMPIRPCDQPFPIATSGTYDLVVKASEPGMQYTLRATAR